MKTKFIVNEETIRKHLPATPDGYFYEVSQDSSMWWRVDLIHPSEYTYTTEKVYTIWGYVKRTGMVHPPINAKKPRLREELCHLVDSSTLSPYTTIVPKETGLFGLL